jgi:ubiquinone/menaquinone biosynthesis C-methylase UbiE
MNAHQINERYAEQAFSRQSGIFDDIYSGNGIVNYKRDRVREHVLQYLEPGASILELNSGTGEDAVFFAKRGHFVHATDIAIGMQEQLKNKAAANKLSHLISNEICSFTQLELLKNKGQYDHIFSNFAGLNCTNELDKVIASLPNLLKPGGTVTMVILPGFCLWETVLLFRGKFKTAFRRFFSKNGRKAHLEGIYFTCWYHNPSKIARLAKQDFEVLAIEGLCTIVPPSYIENFDIKYPTTFQWLKKWEYKLRNTWPFRVMGDYYIISLRKKKDISIT